MHYVIGDVHGCFDDMIFLINIIESEDSDARFYFVGDFIDRGPKVWETLNWAIENITEGGRYQAVRGNHEQLAKEYLDKYISWYRYLEYTNETGENKPSYHYDFDKLLENNIKGTGIKGQIPPEAISKYRDFFEGLPYSIELSLVSKWGVLITYRIVHAFYDYCVTSDEEQHSCNLWKRVNYGNKESDEIIVRGHTPTFNIDYRWWDNTNTKPGMISYRENDINVDGGCVWASQFPEFPDMLCAIRLEDLEEIYPYDIETRFSQLADNNYLNFNPKDRTEKYYDEYVNHRFTHREKMLGKLGHPDYQESEGDEIKHIVGSPLYMVGEDVTFKNGKDILNGTIEVIDEFGIFTDREQPYYQILVNEKDGPMYYKDIPESDIIQE